MRHGRTIAAALLVLLSMVGCQGRVPPAAAGHSVVRPVLGFAMNVPAGWTVRDLSGDVVLEVVAQNPPAGNAPKADHPTATTSSAAPEHRPERTRTIVQVTVIEREGIALNAWVDQALRNEQELQGDLEVVRRESATLADGRPALRLTLKSPRGVEPFLQEMLLTVTDTRAYAVIATAPASDFQAAAHDLATCFDSFLVW